ncbi:transglutaminase family protein [Parafrankia discariae]|uniref:transglutaminase family protein n=1 Tax=Parafrankia discariae TaxID=365528 RepID=UPI0003A3A3DB|nr:transglutaminase-like domain-containing protein [Parafrankia discariae]
MSAHSRRMFATVVRREPVDLALACHLIAAEAGPETNPAETTRALDALAADAAALLAAHRAAPRGRDAAGAAAGTGTDTGAASGAEATAEAASGDPAADPGMTERSTADRGTAAGAGAADRGTAAGAGANAGGGTLTGLDLRAAAEALRESLGRRAGFAGHESDYDDVRASLLPEVISRRRGLPILLSIVWIEVARRIGVPAYAVGLPGHVIVAVGAPHENVLVDPYAGGEIMTVHDAAARVRAAGAPFTRAQLAPMTPDDLLTRVLGNIRVLAARTDVPRTRLWAVELSLLLPRHPAALRRERGELRVRLGDFLGGAADLTNFADAVTTVEPAAAAAARHSAAAARARLN